MASEKIYDMWARTEPQWEKRYEDLIKGFCDYGKGVNSFREDRAKIFGAGYEIFIIAFYIGLYYGQKRKLNDDATQLKKFGWAIQNWGHIEQRKGRKPYPKLIEFIFVALVARTDVDWIALDKGDITARKVVGQLMQTMEEYANFGFNYMDDQMRENPGCLYQEDAFLRIFLTFDSSSGENPINEEDDDEPESLD
ncbi:MAG: glycoside hydrolase family 15 [Paludibacteraceae bacterium]|nr:glycoside hydrolase family 15 [Paludibacteraceae bacterium]